MHFAGNSARFSARFLLQFLSIAVFSLWVSDASALAPGGGSPGGDGPDSPGGQSGGGGGGGGENGNARDRDRGGYVARSKTNVVDVPTGFVVSDDICTGGKYEKC